MRKILIVAVIIVSLFGAYLLFFKKSKPQEAAPVPQAIQKHEAAFYATMDSLLVAFEQMQEAFVQADTGSIKKRASLFIEKMDLIDTASFKNDSSNIRLAILSTMQDMRANARSMLDQTNITDMRYDLKSLNDVMFPAFFKLTNYPKKIYYFNCNMAFNDSEEANWLSSSSVKRNPYLGVNHPKHANTMLQCGLLKDSLP
jgi:hypothetical protein